MASPNSHRLTASRFAWLNRSHHDRSVATYKSPVATGDSQPSVSGDCNGIHDKEVMRFEKPWDFSDGADVVLVHLMEVTLLTDRSFPYRAIAVERYVRDIRAGVR